ncbi:MAG: hypothetical protein KA314_04390 [Chloroflexi bacterium]|nr:hypothetical protein [Chloroflexota bacterium]MBP8055052.1 hypothetical protein [Chloroflexota bacterium]
MNEFLAVAIVVLMFVLRFALPLLFMFLMGYFLNRVYARWEGQPPVSHKSNG